MNLANNPNYVCVFESKVHKDLKLYAPASGIEYHTSRYLAASAQNIYSESGATKEVLESIMDSIIKLCNDEKQVKTLRTDVATLANNIKYRLRYPVDELCALRMGAIFCFIEGENPDVCADAYTRHKVELATGNFDKRISPDPDLYSFFFRTGVTYTPAYAQLQDTLTDTDYLSKRMEALQALTLPLSPTG